MTSGAAYAHPEALATTEWLADHLDDPSIRVVDARFSVRATGDGTLEAVAERDAYRAAHIPGAVFVDVMTDVADSDNPVAVAAPDQFEALMGRLGIADHHTVVIYDDQGGMWAARLWWALRYYGHEAVKLLDGGLTSWQAEGRPTDDEVPDPLPAAFTARARPDLRVDAEEVARAIGRHDVCIVDALPEVFFTGAARLYPSHRSGHIPTARNVPAPAHVDPTTKTLMPASELLRLWQPVGLDPGLRIITYCGGGVFGAFDLFALYVMGHENAALYDASWMEWGADPRRPVETGPGPVTNDRDGSTEPRR